MLTIIIFTNGRYTYLSPLLKDIIKSEAKVKVWIIDYFSKNKKKTINSLSYKECIDKLHFKNDKIKIVIDKNYYTFAKRFLKYLKKVKTKFAWFVGDDDRIDAKYLKNLVEYLKFQKNSGFTLDHIAFNKNEDIENKINVLKKISSEDFNLKRYVSKIGLISTQIINVNKYNKISKLLNKEILLDNGSPQIYIIFQLIKIFNDWKYIPNKIVFYRYGNFTMKKKYLITERLNHEFNGCLQPAKEIFGFDSNMYKNILKKVFFQNFISWIIYSLQYLGRKKTFEIINRNRYLMLNNKYINCILFIISITPVKTFFILKFIRKKFNLY
jgi:hypothetical protein